MSSFDGWKWKLSQRSHSYHNEMSQSTTDQPTRSACSSDESDTGIPDRDTLMTNPDLLGPFARQINSVPQPNGDQVRP
jgi:hypothetical protein